MLLPESRAETLFLQGKKRENAQYRYPIYCIHYAITERALCKVGKITLNPQAFEAEGVSAGHTVNSPSPGTKRSRSALFAGGADLGLVIVDTISHRRFFAGELR
jgi:hypothetical protein